MPEYKATVIIPVYNVEKFVESCLVSLTEQTIGFENIEVLLQHAHKDRAVQFGIVRDQQLSLIHEKTSPSGRTAKGQPARRRRPRSGVLNIYLVSQPAARMAPSASSSVGSTLG